MSKRVDLNNNIKKNRCPPHALDLPTTYDAAAVALSDPAAAAGAADERVSAVARAPLGAHTLPLAPNWFPTWEPWFPCDPLSGKIATATRPANAEAPGDMSAILAESVSHSFDTAAEVSVSARERSALDPSVSRPFRWETDVCEELAPLLPT